MSDKQSLVNTARRRAWVLDQLSKGKTTRTVADEAEEKWGEEQLPNGWDSRYVSKDAKRALDQARKEVAEKARRYHTLQVRQLEHILDQLAPMAEWHEVEELNEDGEKVTIMQPPDLKAIDRILAIMDRLANYYNVDEAPDMGDAGDTNIFVQVNQELKSR